MMLLQTLTDCFPTFVDVEAELLKLAILGGIISGAWMLNKMGIDV